MSVKTSLYALAEVSLIISYDAGLSITTLKDHTGVLGWATRYLMSLLFLKHEGKFVAKSSLEAS